MVQSLAVPLLEIESEVRQPPIRSLELRESDDDPSIRRQYRPLVMEDRQVKEHAIEPRNQYGGDQQEQSLAQCLCHHRTIAVPPDEIH
jgi:hypothetical protein